VVKNPLSGDIQGRYADSCFILGFIIRFRLKKSYATLPAPEVTDSYRTGHVVVDKTGSGKKAQGAMVTALRAFLFTFTSPVPL
jgi:hypothetical protein